MLTKFQEAGASVCVNDAKTRAQLVILVSAVCSLQRGGVVRNALGKVARLERLITLLLARHNLLQRVVVCVRCFSRCCWVLIITTYDILCDKVVVGQHASHLLLLARAVRVCDGNGASEVRAL